MIEEAWQKNYRSDGGMRMYDWKFSGTAYGRTYDSRVKFVKKMEIRLPTEIIEQHLEMARRKNDPKYRKLVEIQEQAWFKTETDDDIMVSPRYSGSRLGRDDDGQGNTICAFFFNGNYDALALYNENNKEIIVIY